MVKQICAALESSLFDGLGKERRGKPGADDTGNENDGEQAMSGPLPIILALGITQTQYETAMRRLRRWADTKE